MLVKHPVNGKLYNVISDEHAAGVLWMAAPLVVIDTYEHAFYIVKNGCPAASGHRDRLLRNGLGGVGGVTGAPLDARA